MAEKRPVDLRDLLHEPYRAMDETEVHLWTARQLSRALHMAFSANAAEFPLDDPRNREAIATLISEVAFHASAAEYQHAIESDPTIERLRRVSA
jgi:hypothetical protein